MNANFLQKGIQAKMLDENLKKELLEHLHSDVAYPASRQQILAACGNMTMHSAQVKKHAEMLPDKIFKNADEAASALGL
ncbi:MAG TPA: hypothetical protein VHM28_07565 [Anaerolineales bacterium]|nr:hypothetical protein [Anaerolineales bacterium]